MIRGERVKKKLFGIGMLCCLLATGCFGKGNKDITNTLIEKIEKAKSYHITGELEIINNEDSYEYDVEVSYKEEDYFRVSLKNKTNNHEQIILRNLEGVYVLTPSLNKSFKFQSDWPYNNSQSYLPQILVKDIQNDKSKTVEEKEDGYMISTSVNYSNNKNLKKQKIYVDKKGNIEKVEVLNAEDIVRMRMTFKKIDIGATFDKDYFELSQNMKTTETIAETSKTIDDVIYPMYMPANTYLESQDIVKKEDGERIILTFGGASPFMLVEETVTVEDDMMIIPVYGEPELLLDTIGSITENSANWISNGIEYYAVSDTLTGEELLQVVQSISVIPVMNMK